MQTTALYARAGPGVLSAIGSDQDWFTSALEADQDHLFSWVSVRLYGVHQSTIAVFTPAQKIRTKGGNKPELVLIEPNKTGVNTPLVKSWLLISDFSCYLWHLWSMLTVKSENRGKLVTSLTRNVNRDTAVRGRDNKLVTGQMLMLSEQSEMA